ncbi:unnamed protein product [Aphis gossypii]|uniref:Uncharacterized protein n=1 Tax=Aphis gossypii TaxID=80765 RepID=A0A9P0N889_APHGO|nr:unnamed protein product [Aphis gossypii]
MKQCGIIITHIAEFLFHCYLGEIISRMHNHLEEKVYNMTWYDMPNPHKKFLMIMLQRTQKDLVPNAAIFSSHSLSRSLMTKFVKQIYTLLNVLLKT